MTETNPGKERKIQVVDRRFWVRTDDTDENESFRKPTFVETLESQISEKQAKLETLREDYKKALAEFEDAKARMRRDIAKEVSLHRRAVLQEMLEVLDNLDRATESLSGATTVVQVKDGLDMVRQHFIGKLEGFGVKRMVSLDATFDPARHEAVSIVPNQTPEKNNRIVGVIKEGYMLEDNVLRPASVAVAGNAG